MRLLPKESGRIPTTYLGPGDSSVLLGLLASSGRAELPGVANPKGWRGHSWLCWADSPVLLLVLCHSKLLTGRWICGRREQPGSAGNACTGMLEGLQATAAGTSACHPGVSKVQQPFGRKMKLLQKASVGIWEELPIPARGGAAVGFAGGSLQSCAVPGDSKGTARGQQAPVHAAVPPACRLPSSLPALPGWVTKPDRCHVPRDTGHFLPASQPADLRALFSILFF